MRTFIGIVLAVFLATGVALGSLALAGHTASGITGLTPRQAADAAVASLGSSPYTQIEIGLSGPAGAPAAAVSGRLRVDVDLATTNPPTDLRNAPAREVDGSVSVFDGARLLAGFRTVGGELYLNLDLGSAGSASRFGGLGGGLGSVIPRLLSGRWFELPSGLGALVTPGTASGAATSGADGNALSGAIARATSFADAPPSGADRVVVATGSARAVYDELPVGIRALIGLGLRRALGTRPIPSESGAYRVTMTMTPGGELVSGEATVGSDNVTADVSHESLPIGAPPDAASLPLGLIRALLNALSSGLASGGSPSGPSI